jgi:phosphotransacetylase
MDLKEPTPSGDTVLAFGDCAVIPDPTAEQLVDIGLATAQTYRDLTGCEPRVAYLSFSTKGSAGGPLVEKVQKAVELAKQATELRTAGYGTTRLNHFSKVPAKNSERKIPTRKDLKLRFKLL